MNIKRVIVTIAMVFTGLCLPADAVSACSVVTTTPSVLLSDSNIAFRGRTIKFDHDSGRIVFEVIEPFKGAVTKGSKVAVANDASCTAPLSLLKEYVVYARWEGDRLMIDAGTARQVAKAEEDLKFLRQKK